MFLQPNLQLIVIPTSYSLKSLTESEANIALNYDLGLRSEISFDSSRDAAIDFFIGNKTQEIKRPTSIKSFIFMYGAETTEYISNGILGDDLQTIKVFGRTSVERGPVRVLDFNNRTLLSSFNEEVDLYLPSPNIIKLKRKLENVTSKYVSIINSRGFITDAVDNFDILNQSYSNSEFKIIAELHNQ